MADANFDAFNSSSAYTRTDNKVFASWFKIMFCIKY